MVVQTFSSGMGSEQEIMLQKYQNQFKEKENSNKNKGNIIIKK